MILIRGIIIEIFNEMNEDLHSVLLFANIHSDYVIITAKRIEKFEWKRIVSSVIIRENLQTQSNKKFIKM